MSNRMQFGDWEKLRNKALERDDGQCVNCGSRVSVEVHHIVPNDGRGNDILTNLATLCTKCHDDTHERVTGNNMSASVGRVDRESVVPIRKAIDAYNDATHPLRRPIIALHLLYGVGVGEVANLRLSHLTVSDDDLASSYDDLRLGDSWQLKVKAYGEHASTRSRIEETTLPIIDPVKSDLARWLLARPDSWSNKLFLSTSDWGSPANLKIVNHQVSKTDLTPLNYIMSFRRQMPLEWGVKKYVQTGDDSEIGGLDDVRHSYTAHLDMFLDEMQAKPVSTKVKLP